MLAGLGRDGGLYVPAAWPRLDTDAIPEGDLARMTREAYGRFRHPAVAPLVQFGMSDFILELFHGPTLAFKDLAMQLLGQLMDEVLTTRGERSTVVVATSGDTGGAAIEAFRGRKRTDLFVLFPCGRISDVQRRMMTTVEDDNVHALAIEGTFDDCQAVVLGSPHRKVAFTVPTGNFGDIYAGYVALCMGLPVDRLTVATNVNDILPRTIATGTYELRDVVPTSSPSMDIQVASNFERVLFDVYGRDGRSVRALMASLAQSRRFVLSASALSQLRAVFSADRADEEEIAATIRTMLRETGHLIDPHTAVGVAVAEKEIRDPSIPMVVLGTAHPAKFPDAVEAASGVRPALPDWLADLDQRPERVITLPIDQIAVERHILSVSRAAHEGAAA